MPSNKKKFLPQKSVTKAESYQRYYKNAGKLFSNAVSVMGIVTSILPRGASDYCDFIFTAAKNTDKMAKVVYDYTTKQENAMKELDKVTKGKGNLIEERNSLICREILSANSG